MSIIDLDTNSHYDQGIITASVADSFVESSPKFGVMLIHIFCHDKVKILTPFYLSLGLLDSILNMLCTEPYGECLSIRVSHTVRQDEKFYYEPTMELLRALISRVLEKRRKETMRFVFSGIQPWGLVTDNRPGLARFLIDMGRLMNSVLPQEQQRKVKCVFCGDILFGCLVDYLKSEKGLKRGDPDEQEIFRKILMLKWNGSRGEGSYSWLRWGTKLELR